MQIFGIIICLIAVAAVIYTLISPNKSDPTPAKTMNSLETNVNIIRQWVTFFGVITILSILVSFFLVGGLIN